METTNCRKCGSELPYIKGEKVVTCTCGYSQEIPTENIQPFISELKYITADMLTPQGKPRVYFCCHPKAHHNCFQDVLQDILPCCNCAIWYPAEPDQPRTDAFWEDLLQMQLFVVPITRALLTEPNPAMDLEVPFALSQHIPILPLMQETGLETLYSEKFGNLQFLDKLTPSEAALSYEEKLKKYLGSVLVSDKLLPMIQNAFDAYVFLSYRKKDRKLAQELMRLIHKNDFCRDIAFWYDEYLTPGEDFNDSIRKAIKKCDLFAMAVTPNLVNEANYVQKHEYPTAREFEKPILPIEMATTSKASLSLQYAQIPPCADGHDRDNLAQMLRQALLQISLRTKNDPQHTFFIGVAYLNGIDVDVNHQLARELITEAAEAGITAAAEMLATMYGEGHGVPRNTEKMMHWQQRLVDYRRRDYKDAPNTETGLLLYEQMCTLADVWNFIGQTEKYTSLLAEMQNLGEELYRISPANSSVCRSLAAAYTRKGEHCSANGEQEKALEYFEKSERLLMEQIKRAGITICTDTPGSKLRPDVISFPNDDMPNEQLTLLSDFCVALFNKGDALRRSAAETDNRQRAAMALDLFLRAHEYLVSDALRFGLPDRMKMLSTVYGRLGEMESMRNDLPAAREWLKKAIFVDERLLSKAQGRDRGPATEAYARSCLQYALTNDGKPDLFYLENTIELFKKLAISAPKVPMYREYVEELEPYLAECKKIEARLRKEEEEREANDKKRLIKIDKAAVGDFLHTLAHDQGYAEFCKAMDEEEAEAMRRMEERRQRKRKKEDIKAINHIQKALEEETLLKDATIRAKEGDPEAMVQLAELYANGETIRRDPEKAIAYAERAEAIKRSTGFPWLVEYYKERDPKKAEDYKSQGNKLHKEQQDNQQKFDLLNEKADHDDSDALLRLADYYLLGSYPVKQDKRRALQYAQRALAQHNHDAHSWLSGYYRDNGDPKKARKHATMGVLRLNTTTCRMLYRRSSNKLARGFFKLMRDISTYHQQRKPKKKQTKATKKGKFSKGNR